LPLAAGLLTLGAQRMPLKRKLLLLAAILIAVASRTTVWRQLFFPAYCLT
jgi:hypothetical protein